MFGPNARTLFCDSDYFHHREPKYQSLLIATEHLFREKFQIGEEFDVIFMTGSGTIANEAVLRSLIGSVEVRGYGEFSRRLRLMATPGHLFAHHHAVVAYETGESHPLPPELLSPKPQGILFADCVSSFPYYPPPPEADIWTTVSSKQLGALPVMGIIVIRNRAWEWLEKSDRYSYLNLSRWKEARKERRESPHSPSIPLLHDLKCILQIFDVAGWKHLIDRRRHYLSQLFTPDQIVGEGPVFTVKIDAISSTLATYYNLYKSSHGWQFFLWTGKEHEYQEFIQSFKKDHARRR